MAKTSVFNLTQVLRALVFVALLFISPLTYSLACSVYFPQGVNGAGATSEVNINDPTVSLQNQTFIPAGNVQLCGTCTANCQAGTTCGIQSEVPLLPNPGAWQSDSTNTDINMNTGTQVFINTGTFERDDVTVSGDGTLNFSSTGPDNIYRFDDVDVSGTGQIILGEGTYYIDTLTVSGNGSVILAPTGNVELYIRTSITISDSGNINNTDPVTSEANRLFVYIYGRGTNDVILENDGKMDAILYSDQSGQQDIILRNNFEFRGAITSQKMIEVEDSATITYQATKVDEVVAGGLCNTPFTLLTHFVINHSTNAVYCLPTVITVSARDSSNNIITDFDETIVLDTGSGRGTWTLNAGNGAFSDAAADDGIASYTFSESDNGIASFNLDYKDGPSPINITTYLQSNPGIADDDTEGLLNFSPQGFVLTEAAIPGSPTGTPASYNATQTAGISDVIHITAYGQLPFGACGVIESYAGNKDIKFWMDYTDPNSGQGVVASIDTNPIATAEGSASNQTVNFNLGRASVNALYRDVGLIKVHAKDDSGAMTIQGATDNYVVKPAQFAFTVIENIDGVANTAPTDATGDAFSVAGENFTVRLEVQDNDGNITPNYGNESSPEGILLSSDQLVAPSGGRNGSANNGFIENGSVFSKISNGVFEGTTFQFDEVGIITLRAEIGDQDYLGGGNVISISENVGRFYPARFAALRNTPEIASTCNPGGFTYLNTIAGTSQNFNYRDNVTYNPQISIEAQEKGDGVTGTTTQNYTGTFFKLVASDVAGTYSSNSGSFSPSTNDLLNLTVVDNATDVTVTGGSGTGTIGFVHASGFGFEKDATGGNTPNFTAEIQLLATFSDSDGVEGIESDSTDIIFGGTTPLSGIAFFGSSFDLVYNKIYQGRMALENVAGSELSGLTMPMRAEYFNGTDFLLNPFEDFTCTNFINAANINVISTNPGSVSVTVGSVTQGTTPGTWNINLDPPSPTATVDAEIESDISATGENLDHLQHDWPYDGIDGLFDDNPRGQASYGISAGEDNLIFIKEIF